MDGSPCSTSYLAKWGLALFILFLRWLGGQLTSPAGEMLNFVLRWKSRNEICLNKREVTVPAFRYLIEWLYTAQVPQHFLNLILNIFLPSFYYLFLRCSPRCFLSVLPVVPVFFPPVFGIILSFLSRCLSWRWPWRSVLCISSIQCSGSGSVGPVCFWTSRIRIR